VEEVDVKVVVSVDVIVVEVNVEGFGAGVGVRSSGATSPATDKPHSVQITGHDIMPPRKFIGPQLASCN